MNEIGKNQKIEINWKIEKYSKSGPNQGSNERPKGEPVAVGDLKASFQNNLISFVLSDPEIE